MARMRPELSDFQLSKLQSKAEATFYRACQDQLDDRYLVVHSMNWIRVGPDGQPRDGESDFTIADPNGGIIVVEIKGGGVGFDPVSGKWYSISGRGDRHTIKDPFHQAKVEKYAVLEQLKSSRRWGHRRVLIGHAVFLPDVANVDRVISPQSPPQIIGGRSNLRDIPGWLQCVSEYWKGEGRDVKPLGVDGLEVIEDMFCRPIDVRPLVSARLEDEEVVRIRLTQQQSRQLRMLGTRTRAAICGGAGTGKTLLALEKARQLASDGHHTLLLCYNRALADHLKVAVGQNPRLLPMTFHQLCDWFIRKALVEQGTDVMAEAREAYPGADEWHVQMPFALALAVESLPDRFDAIIIDEGQDFRSDYWFAIDSLLRHSSESLLYVFYDSNQAVYERIQNLPIREEPYPLTINCRNTRYIHDAAYAFFRGEDTDPPEIDGVPVNLLPAPSPEAQCRRIHAAVTRLLDIELVPPADVAVLVAGYPKDIYYDLLRRHKLPHGVTWSIEAHRVPNTVLVDTVHRYKGLEAAIVFLCGVDRLDPELDCETIYVGMSRAKSELYIAGTEAACQSIVSIT